MTHHDTIAHASPLLFSVRYQDGPPSACSDWRHKERSSVVRIHRSRVARCESPHILPSPHIMDLERAGPEAGYVREVECLRRCRIARVDDKDVRALGGRAGVKLWWRRARRR